MNARGNLDGNASDPKTAFKQYLGTELPFEISDWKLKISVCIDSHVTCRGSRSSASLPMALRECRAKTYLHQLSLSSYL